MTDLTTMPESTIRVRDARNLRVAREFLEVVVRDLDAAKLLLAAESSPDAKAASHLISECLVDVHAVGSRLARVDVYAR
jgi:hypothetical protein